MAMVQICVKKTYRDFYTIFSIVFSSTRRFLVSLAFCLVLVIFFFSPFSIAITTLVKERAGLCAFVHLFVSLLLFYVYFFSSSWYQGLAATYYCGTP